MLLVVWQVHQKVKLSIKNEFPKTFGVIFDGWSCAGEHYIAIFATWVTKRGAVAERLLACGVQDLPDSDQTVFAMLKRYLELQPILPTCSFKAATWQKTFW